MPGRERRRERERNIYERILHWFRADRDRSVEGRVVVRAEDQPWAVSRQGLARHYLVPSVWSGHPVDTVLDDWYVFVQEIHEHSGKHRHQGGLVIYILDGAGYSIVEGERHDWEAGDLLLLPLRPGGVEHQHFNSQPDRPVRWIAFISAGLFQFGASEMVQLENAPAFDAAQREAERPRRGVPGDSHP